MVNYLRVGEPLGYEHRVNPTTLEASVGALQAQLDFQGNVHAPSGDPLIANLCRDMSAELEINSRFRAIIEAFCSIRGVGKRRGTSPDEAVGIVRTSIMNDLLFFSDTPEFPTDDYYKPQAFRPVIENYVEVIYQKNVQEREETAIKNLHTRKVGTPVKTRYMIAELFAQTVLAERFPDEALLALDYGSSVGVGPNMLMRKSEVPIPPVHILNDFTKPDSPNSELTQKVNQRLERASRFGKFVLIDTEAVYRNDLKEYDPKEIDWASSGLRPVSELGNPAFRASHRLLTENLSPGVVFLAADFTKPENDEGYAIFREEYPEKYFHLITVHTAFHQMSLEKQQFALRQMKRYLRPGGIIEVSDFERGKPWHDQPGRYQSWFYDSENPRAGIQPFAKFDDSRCRRMVGVRSPVFSDILACAA